MMSLFISECVNYKLVQNFLKFAQEFFKRCLKLLGFSKKLYESCSLTQVKMTAFVAFSTSLFYQTHLLPAIDFLMYNCVMSFVFLQNQSSITFYTDNSW